MKKITLLIVFTLVSFYTSYSQTLDDTSKDKKTNFGVRLGYSSITDTSILETGFREASVYFGFFAETRIAERWSLQTEFNVVMDEFAFKDLSNTEFEIPVLIKYHLNDKVSLFAGPQLDTYISNKLSLQLSGVVGAQIKISKRIFIEGRYNFRFEDANIAQRFRPFIKKSDFEIGGVFKF